MSEKTILQVDNVSLELGGKRILNHLSMDIWTGHVHAIVGVNGAGKSTLASTIMGLNGYRHFEGDILFEGQSIKNMNVAERARLGITLAWQEPARYEGLTVEKFILAGAGNACSHTVERALQTLGLDPGKYAQRAVDRTLSGGERKRVELASIVAMRPRLVIMDEPDSGIDVDALNRIFDTLKILRDHGSTVILITHSMTVLKQADHAFLLCCGNVLDKGGIDKIEGFFGRKCQGCDHQNKPDQEELNGE
ncbi:ATP-binding cassette domain-containing protein [bacterium]|nr:ATP-binding cassette domain-containing protein [bacterium]